MAKLLDIRDLPRRRIYRLRLRAAFLASGLIAAFVTSILLEEKAYVWAIMPAVLVMTATLAEFVLADALTERRYPARTEEILDKLEANVLVVHDQIIASIDGAIDTLRGCDRSKVSGTFHLLVELYSSAEEESEWEPALVQVTKYSGRLGGPPWRFTGTLKGVVGRCVRTGKPEWVNFSSFDEYRIRMVSEFGFTNEEFQRLTGEARSYWAHPVFRDERIVGVMYLFTTEVQVFPVAANPNALTASANEIAAYLAGVGVI